MSEPTCRALCYSGDGCFSNVRVYLLALCYSGKDCLSCVRTYLPRTVLQGCRLFKQCLNLPARHSVTVVKAVLAMSESTCLALCYSGADCFKRCQNLPAGHCVTEVKAVLAMSESTCRTLCYSDAGCLSNVRNYLPGTVMQGCRLFKRCQNLPAGHCVTVVKAALAMSEPTCRALCCRGADC